MVFYESIAQFYDEIFPFQPAQLSFVKNYSPTDASILDIGCGTGTLATALQGSGCNVKAIDTDDGMLKIARLKSDAVSFSQLNMLEIQDHFQERSFDTVLCFGNTLVHLPNNSSVEEALRQQVSLLKEGGRLLVQIINYDYILDQKQKGLPTLETQNLKFERNYLYDQSSTTIDFQTCLQQKVTGQQLVNTVPLIPLLRNEIEAMFKKLGAKDICRFSDFRMQRFNETSQRVIYAVSFA